MSREAHPDERLLLRRFVHDARTPVTVIGGFADLLLQAGDGMPAAGRRDALQRIADAAAELRGLLDALDAATGPPA